MPLCLLSSSLPSLLLLLLHCSLSNKVSANSMPSAQFAVLKFFLSLTSERKKIVWLAQKNLLGWRNLLCMFILLYIPMPGHTATLLL